MKRLTTLLVTSLLLPALSATAQDAVYPNGPITLVAPFAAGGTSDALARAIAADLGERLGQPVIVENRPGAGGTIGLTEVARARPDGYTIGLGGAGSLVHSAGIYASVIQFDVATDFAPISLLASAPVVAASPELSLTDLASLVDHAKASPDFPYGTAGVGGAMHLAGEVFQREAGVSLLHVPYAGVAPAVTELLGGQIQLGFFDTSAVLPYAAGGTMNVLAVASTERAPQLPDVPTFAEQGFPETVVEIWYGLVAPAGTPEAVVDALEVATTEAAASPQFLETISTLGFRPLDTGKVVMADLIKADLQKWLPIIAEAGISAQ